VWSFVGGTAAQLLASLDTLATLPDATLVCCAHEYTLANLRFAATVEPSNRLLQDHRQACERLQAHGRPTVPTALARERQINPFLRCEIPEVVAAARAWKDGCEADRLSVFTTLRLWKNQFR